MRARHILAATSTALRDVPIEGGGGGDSYILVIRVCAAGKGMAFKPFTLG